MNLTKNLISIFLTSVLGACDSREVWRDGEYSVSWIDTADNRALRFDIGNGDTIERVPKKVISVGSNAEYVVALQKRDNSLKYFIVNRRGDGAEAKVREVVMGPFSENEFNEKTKALGLPEFTWSSD